MYGLSLEMIYFNVADKDRLLLTFCSLIISVFSLFVRLFDCYFYTHKFNHIFLSSFTLNVEDKSGFRSNI